MTNVLVSGYRPFDISIMDEKDIRIKIIKTAIRRDLIRLLEEGVDWFIFTGNLGFEAWVLEIAKELQERYEFQLATIFLFENQRYSWSEANQSILERFKQVAFVKYAYPSYESPSQFREYNKFLVQNTDGAYLFYDSEMETNLKYLYREMMNSQQYFIKRLSFDDLNGVAENFSEK